MSREQSIELSRRFLATLRKSTSLNEPVSFAQVRVGPFREPVYSVTWPGPVNVETSPEGVVVGYMDLQLARKPEERNRLTNAVEALNIAMDIADGLEILLNEARVTEIKRVALPNRRSYWSCRWDHFNSEAQPSRVKGEFARVDLEVEDSELLSFYKTSWSPMRRVPPTLDPLKAVATAFRRYLDFFEKPPVSLQVSHEWVHPHRFLEGKLEFDREIRPCWVVSLTESNGRWVEAWVDTESSEIVGGDVGR